MTIDRRPRANLSMHFLIVFVILSCSSLGQAQTNNQAVPAPSSPAQAESALKEMEDSLKRVRRAIGMIYTEANRRSVVWDQRQSALDDYIMDPWMSVAPAAYPFRIENDTFDSPTGPLLPPRKQWLDMDMTTLKQALNVLRDQNLTVQSLPQSAGKDSSLAAMSVMQDTYKELDSQYNQLSTLTSGPKFDNAQIGKLATAMKDEVESMGVLRKKLLRQIKRESTN